MEIRWSYLHNEISFTGMITLLYQIRILILAQKCSFRDTLYLYINMLQIPYISPDKLCVVFSESVRENTWWGHQMETFSALLAICVGNSPVTGEFLTQRPVTWSFDVFFDLCLNKWLSKHSWGWWFETLSPLLWCHCNEMPYQKFPIYTTYHHLLLFEVPW